MTVRAILVARVSTKRQASQGHYSLDAQFRMMRDVCERRGIEVWEERLEPGKSAFTPNLHQLPVLHQTILDIEAGKANALVMHETTRLARNEQLGHHILDRLTSCGASFINSLMEIDYTSPEGRQFFNQEVGMAAYSSRKTSQHAKKSKREQFLMGLQVGQVPFGYIAQLSADGSPNRKVPMEIVPLEAAAIKQAFQNWALGTNAHQLTREWNDAGFKPRSTKGLDYFQPQTIRGILQNRVYLGEVQHLGEWRQGLHEPIVTPEEFDAAQRPKLVVARRVHDPLLLRGVAKCPEGHRLYDHRVRHSPRNTDQRHAYYREPSLDFHRPCAQAGKLWRAAEPDAQIEALLRSLAMDGDWLAFVDASARGGARDTTHERRRLEQRIDRLQGEYLDGHMTKERYFERRAECERGLAQLVAVDTPLAITASRLNSWVGLWDGASADARNMACRLVFDSVELDFVQREVKLVPNAEFESLLDARARYVRQDWPGPG
jgi:DNA invertase Pin-like site-specific DNA recombinase